MPPTKFKQLIPGNPGTSFVVALMYAAQHKYKNHLDNELQLELFTKGIVNSKNVFFGGVLNNVASKLGHNIHVFINENFLIDLAQSELNKELVRIEYNELNAKSVEKLLEEYDFVVLSVDMCFFNIYHDYHFVCIHKNSGRYEVFEPKNGEKQVMATEKFDTLVNSVPQGLNDVMMAFCL